MIIVEYRDRYLTDACIASLVQGTFQDFFIFLVDNTPSPVDCQMTKSQRFQDMPDRSNLEYIATGKNLGFCAGCNVGIELSLSRDFDYVLILNYDTVVSPAFLQNLVTRAQAIQGFGILGAKIHYQRAEKIIWYAGGKLSRLLGVGKHFGIENLDNGSYDAFREVSYVTGCCMLVPTEVFRIVGPFKSELFMYLDDAEFCLRVIEQGLKLYYEPKAILVHRVGPGFGKKNYPDYYLYFSIRNKPWITRNPIYRIYLMGITVILASAKLVYYMVTPRIESRSRKIRAIVLGLWDSFTLINPVEKRFPGLFEVKT